VSPDTLAEVIHSVVTAPADVDIHDVSLKPPPRVQ
jgi:hypothetical protein